MQPESEGGNPQLMTPETYNAVIERLVPVEIKLVDLAFHVKSAVSSGPLFTSVDLMGPELLEVQQLGDPEVFADISQSANFKISASDGTTAAEGRCVYKVRLKIEFEPPREFWKIFLIRNVKIYTHPALRELVASLASRANLMAVPLGSVSVRQNQSSTPVIVGAIGSAQSTLPQSSHPSE